MRVLESFVSAFTRAFGITQPTEQSRRRASKIILAMLLFMFAAVLVGGALLYHLGNYLPYR